MITNATLDARLQGMRNLERMFVRVDLIDFNEGQQAYLRYHAVMHSIALHYKFPIERVVATFASLSPNSDYKGNLRSTVSVLDGLNNDVPCNQIVVSTYKHCRDRAYRYARGDHDFLKKTKGPKIKNFYHNLVDPLDNRWVTIDGHMVGCWRDSNSTMKQLLIKPHEYREIADAIKILAFKHQMLPNQMQAVLWFARKRTLNIKYDPQGSLFAERGDMWNTLIHIDDIKPYPRTMG